MLKRHIEKEKISLENFEGPLDFLVYLIRKSELDIQEISVQKITEQFLNKISLEDLNNIDLGADFVRDSATLLWLKSKSLLPKHQQLDLEEEDYELDPNFDIIHKLVEYCRFKEAGKKLYRLHLDQNNTFLKGQSYTPPEMPKKLGIEHLTLEDLAHVFQKVLAQAALKNQKLKDEVWRVSDKIHLIRTIFSKKKKIQFHQLFSKNHSKEELIVSFLAVLELMKVGELKAYKENEEIIFSKNDDDHEINSSNP